MVCLPWQTVAAQKENHAACKNNRFEKIVGRGPKPNSFRFPCKPQIQGVKLFLNTAPSLVLHTDATNCSPCAMC